MSMSFPSLRTLARTVGKPRIDSTLEAVMGKTVDEAKDLFGRFHRLVTGGEEKPDFDQLGKLSAFGGVAEFPVRVKCATLAWHTLQAALDGGDDTKVTTE